MAELEGNVLRPPGFGPTVTFDPPDELLASTGHGYIQKGGTLVQNGIYPVGQPVKKGTAGQAKLWVKATGFGDAEGFVRNAVDTTSEVKLANIVLSGTLNCNITALNGLVVNGSGERTALNGNTALNGKFVQGFNYLIF